MNRSLSLFCSLLAIGQVAGVHDQAFAHAPDNPTMASPGIGRQQVE
jgi:hypothetical protein